MGSRRLGKRGGWTCTGEQASPPRKRRMAFRLTWQLNFLIFLQIFLFCRPLFVVRFLSWGGRNWSLMFK